jgi:hypothetical protein
MSKKTGRQTSAAILLAQPCPPGAKTMGDPVHEAAVSDEDDAPTNDPIEAAELARAADWRIKKVGENPSDQVSAKAAKLLQKLADEVRGLVGSAAYTEYLAILNWLGEFDVMGDFAERAREYRMRIGLDHFPTDGEAYLRALIVLAKDAAGA